LQQLTRCHIVVNPELVTILVHITLKNR
jgi:hypothetical protein